MTAKRNICIIIGVIGVFLISSAKAADLSGVWTKTTHPDPHNITLFMIDDTIVKAIGYGMISGKPAIWFAEGWVKGNNLTCTFRYGKEATPEGWEKEGRFQLVVSEDGRSMHGSATSVSGGWSGKIGFRRLKP